MSSVLVAPTPPRSFLPGGTLLLTIIMSPPQISGHAETEACRNSLATVNSDHEPSRVPGRTLASCEHNHAQRRDIRSQSRDAKLRHFQPQLSCLGWNTLSGIAG